MTSSDLPFWKPPPATGKDLRQFGWLFVIIAAAIGAWMYWGSSHPYTSTALLVPPSISLCLALVTLAAPRLLTPAWWPWMVFVRVLGFVNSHLLLALVFFLMFMPIGLVMRLFGRDPLGDRDFRKARQTVADGGSLWRRRDETQLAPHHYERQF